jgi:acyl carrier protein
MNSQEIRNVVIEALRSVAPESEPASLEDSARIRDELDIDSMDFLNFIVAIHAALQVDIPEADYAKVQTLGGAVSYLASKLEPGGS